MVENRSSSSSTGFETDRLPAEGAEESACGIAAVATAAGVVGASFSLLFPAFCCFLLFFSLPAATGWTRDDDAVAAATSPEGTGAILSASFLLAN